MRTRATRLAEATQHRQTATHLPRARAHDADDRRQRRAYTLDRRPEDMLPALEQGWAFRLRVDRFKLNGRAGWRLPLSFGEAFGLQNGETRRLGPLKENLGQEVTLTRKSTVLAGGPIDVVLKRLGAEAEDLAFFCVRTDGAYDMVLRASRELRDGDPLCDLLWRCGLDPTDPDICHAPWGKLGRALGGESRGRDEVQRRLAARKDHELTRLLASVERAVGRTSERWREGWSYCEVPVASQFLALGGGIHGVRVAVGVVDASGQPPRGLEQSDGGVLWLDQPDGFDPDGVGRILQAPPRGMIPAAKRDEWNRWIRAENAARRAALAGREWQVESGPNGWALRGHPYGTLPDALEELVKVEGFVPPPTLRVRTPYPRSALAFQRALDTAVRRGLRSIAAEKTAGFRATYESGRETVGAALMDILQADQPTG